jgi:predicted chitinase
MIEDASAFYAKWREGFGPLSQKEVEGINALLAEMEARGWADKRWWAYVLATAWHETAGTMQPIAEYGRGKGRPYGKPDARTGLAYYGRGLPQITWYDNYAKMGAELGVDLIHNPDLMLTLPVSAAALCVGMEKGLFTGKSLGDYFDGNTDDPVNARRIVNGTDKANLISGYYTTALAAINAGWGEPKPVDRVAELEADLAALRAEVAQLLAWAPTADAAITRLETRRGA